MDNNKDLQKKIFSKLKENKITGWIILLASIIISIGTLINSIKTDYISTAVSIKKMIEPDSEKYTDVSKRKQIEPNIFVSMEIITDAGNICGVADQGVQSIESEDNCLPYNEVLKDYINKNNVYIWGELPIELIITNLHKDKIYLKKIFINIDKYKSEIPNFKIVFDSYTGSAEVGYNSFSTVINSSKKRYDVFSNKLTIQISHKKPTNEDLERIRKGVYEISPNSTEFFSIDISSIQRGLYTIDFTIEYIINGQTQYYTTVEKFNLIELGSPNNDKKLPDSSYYYISIDFSSDLMLDDINKILFKISYLRHCAEFEVDKDGYGSSNILRVGKFIDEDSALNFIKSLSFINEKELLTKRIISIRKSNN